MILTTNDIITLLREAVDVQAKESEVIDPAYLAMSDEDLLLFVKLAVSRAFPDVASLTDLPDGSEYPIVLLAKIELYMKLAVTTAPKVDLGADNNNYIKLDQRFQHYMKLAQSAKDQYENWLDNEGMGVDGGGNGTVHSFEVLLDNRHYTRRNYENQVTPKVSLYIDTVASDSVEFHWKMKNTSHFSCYKVYVCDEQVIDLFKDGEYKSKLNEKAQLVLSTHDIRNTSKRIAGLEANKTYRIAVLSVERNQVWGYAESEIQTPPVFVDEEDISVDTLRKEV